MYWLPITLIILYLSIGPLCYFALKTYGNPTKKTQKGAEQHPF